MKDGSGPSAGYRCVCKIAATIGLMLGGAWTSYTYFSVKAREAETKAIEARRPFLAKRLDIYVELVELASELADADERVDSVHKYFGKEERAAYEKRRVRFEELTLGLLNLVADEKVKIAATSFYVCMDRSENSSPDNTGCNISALAHVLAVECRNSISTEWEVELSETPITRQNLEKLRN